MFSYLSQGIKKSRNIVRFNFLLQCHLQKQMIKNYSFGWILIFFFGGGSLKTPKRPSLCTKTYDEIVNEHNGSTYSILSKKNNKIKMYEFYLLSLSKRLVSLSQL